MEEKLKLRFHKEAFRTLLCGHLIPDLAGIALDYFWVLMFVRSIHLALSFCVILVASVEGLVVYGVILGSRTMDVDVLLTFLQKSKYLHVIIKININVVIIFLGTVLRGG